MSPTQNRKPCPLMLPFVLSSASRSLAFCWNLAKLPAYITSTCVAVAACVYVFIAYEELDTNAITTSDDTSPSTQRARIYPSFCTVMAFPSPTHGN